MWVEVFAGSAALTLAKARHQSEILNDLDDDIVNLFDVLRDDVMAERLAQQVGRTPWSERERARAAAAIVGAPPAADPVERARRYLVRSWQSVSGDRPTLTGFKTHCAANSQSARTWGRLPERIAAAAWRLRDAIILSRPAIDVVAGFAKNPDAVLFVDPPYPLRSINSNSAPYRWMMTDEEHLALALAVRDAKASIILTMSQGTIYDQVLADWWRSPLRVRGMRNSVKTETIHTNFAPALPLWDSAEG
ncbi:DNA methyltransferase [Allostella vacuolata]|nr:DNA methyltransferase [Stella vacuolata]